jgi:lipoprotein signal peptidase
VTPLNHPVRRVVRRALGHRRTTLHPDRSPGRRATDHEPALGWVPPTLIALGVALLDWTSKLLISLFIPMDDLREVVPGRLAFWHVRNPAMVLGLWQNFPLATRKVIALVAAVLGAVLLLQIIGRGHRFPRSHRGWAWVFVGLVLGGMLGNLGERVVHWGVTDFISIRWGDYWLPPGNLADLALFLSMPLCVPVILLEFMGRARRGAASAREPVGEPATGAG